jgi:hypothetical protein
MTVIAASHCPCTCHKSQMTQDVCAAFSRLTPVAPRCQTVDWGKQTTSQRGRLAVVRFSLLVRVATSLDEDLPVSTGELSRSLDTAA